MASSSPAAVKIGRPGARQSWLLLYNCQVMGLGNSLNLLCDDINVEYYAPADFRRNHDTLSARLEDYDRILVSPKLEHELGEAWVGADKVWRVPTISFDAYHPDICCLVDSGSTLKGPLQDYHSLIAYAAFACGLSETQALALYCESAYSSLGYLERWDDARRLLLDSFASEGFDIGRHFVEWSRNGPFMYSFNHPRVHCVRDIAESILARAGLQSCYRDALPHDNLANGPIFPVYPEIAARLGVEGSYLFKLGGKYEFIRLDEFVFESFRIYRGHSGIAAHPQFTGVVDMAIGAIESMQ